MDDLNCQALWRKYRRCCLMLEEWEKAVLADLTELSEGDTAPGTQARREELTKTLRRLYQIKEV